MYDSVTISMYKTQTKATMVDHICDFLISPVVFLLQENISLINNNRFYSFVFEANMNNHDNFFCVIVIVVSNQR